MVLSCPSLLNKVFQLKALLKRKQKLTTQFKAMLSEILKQKSVPPPEVKKKRSIGFGRGDDG
jgi:hypothetical protein